MVESVRALLERAVDYAGLFPPAGLAMRPAVENYAGYRAGADAWALGRFVVPASRLDELARAAEPFLRGHERSGPWQVSALGGPELAIDVQRVAHFNAERSGRAVVDSFEWKAGSVAALEQGAVLLPPDVVGYAELVPDESLPELVAAARIAGVRAKIRTGGVTADAFPTTAALARFITECGRSGVAFKATAGLHHPLRSRYPLTYEANSASAPMFGYLNVFLAAAFVDAGMDAPGTCALLEASAPHELAFTDGGVRWRGLSVGTADIRRVRERCAIAFGSCSFAEPLADLDALSLG